MSGYLAIFSQYAIKGMQGNSIDAAIMRFQMDRCMPVRKYNSDKEVVDASESVALRYRKISRDSGGHYDASMLEVRTHTKPHNYAGK